MRQFIVQKNTKVITKIDDESLVKYFQDISSSKETKVLSREEEIKLAQKIHKGDKKALDKLVCANLRFVISVAKQYQGKGVNLSDLISEGNIGLIRAAETFDETKGFKFISYAVWWIRQAILSALTEQSRMIHIPFNQHNLSSKIEKFIESKKQENGDILSVSNSDISEALDIDINKINKNMNDISGNAVSLSTKIGDEDKSTLEDVIENKNINAPDANLDNQTITNEIEKFVYKLLPKKEADILIMFFGIDRSRALTCQEIGEQFGITKECVRQLKEKGLRRLRLCENSPLKKFIS